MMFTSTAFESVELSLPWHVSLYVVLSSIGLDVFVPLMPVHSPVAFWPVPSPFEPVTVHDMTLRAVHETTVVSNRRSNAGFAVRSASGAGNARQALFEHPA